jgi:hypothetical protein
MQFAVNGTRFDFGINTKWGLGTSTPVDPSYFLDGNWHHIAATYDGSVARVYFDGYQVDEDVFNETIGTNSVDPVSIGANDIYGEYFQGYIDEVRISNKVRESWEFNIYHQDVALSWNMISLPVKVYNPRKSNLFPTATSNSFSYIPGSGYMIRDTLENGIGYWMKFDSTQSIPIPGTPIWKDTIGVVQGWNMIGSISLPIAVTSITSDTPGIITSSFYCYNGGYKTIDSIKPGSGYWVKVNQAGSLILSSSISKNAAARIKIVPTSEMPPPPPSDGSENEQLSTIYALEQCYPNPFNPVTSIKYQLPSNSKVTLKIYNLLGQEVKTLADGTQPTGFKQVEWNSTNNSGAVVASGIYFYRIEATSVADPAKSFTQVKKMILLK